MKEVDVKTFERLVNETISKGLRLYAEGPAGIGKSTIVHETAKRLGLEVVDLRASTIDLGDLIIRVPEEGKMKELVNEILVKDKPFVLLLDEFRHADSSIRRMFYQLIHDGRLGSYSLPEGTAIVALSNPSEEVDTEEIEIPLMDRFDFKVKVKFDFDRWKEWAFKQGIRTEILSFLENFREFTYYKGELPVTPRTWEKVSENFSFYQYILPPQVAVPFGEFVKEVQLFSEVEKYLSGEKPVPHELNKQYALVSAILNRIGEKPDDKIVKQIYEDKIQLREEVKTFLAFAAIKMHWKKTGIQNLAEYINKIPSSLKTKVIARFRDIGYLLTDEMEVSE